MTLVNILADGTQVEDLSGIIISRENEGLYRLIENIKPKIKEDKSDEYQGEYES